MSEENEVIENKATEEKEELSSEASELCSVKGVGIYER